MKQTANQKLLLIRLRILLECEAFLFAIVDYFRKRRAKVVYKINKLKHPDDNNKVLEDSKVITGQEN